jgi:hypothetical protein
MLRLRAQFAHEQARFFIALRDVAALFNKMK